MGKLKVIGRLTPGGSARALAQVLLLAGSCLAQTPGSYRIDPQASRLEIHVFRGGALGRLGDNHQIVVGRFSGGAEAAQGKPWRVHVEAESGSLEVTDPGVSASTRYEVQKTMLGPTQLDAVHYPSIELSSRSLVPGETEGNWRLVADLTLHGVTRQVVFPLAWNRMKDGMRVSGKKELLLLDFNIKPIRKALGTIQVRNNFEVAYDLTLTCVDRGRSE